MTHAFLGGGRSSRFIGKTLRLCGPPMMAKTVLDQFHSLGVENQDIRFDTFGG